MSNKKFAVNWVNSTKLVTERFKPPLSFYNTYQATVRNISFTYPLGWYEGINIWNEINGQPVNYEFGYVSTTSWETDPNSPIGLWFFIGGVPMPKICNKDVVLVEVVTATPVKLKGLSQTVYYCETITSPTYDKTKFIASGGLVSIHPAKPFAHFSIKEYLACHPLTDDWFVYDPANPQKVLFQFGCRSFGLVPAEDGQAFSSKTTALDFFATSYYAQGKHTMLSTTIRVDL